MKLSEGIVNMVAFTFSSRSDFYKIKIFCLSFNNLGLCNMQYNDCSISCSNTPAMVNSFTVNNTKKTSAFIMNLAGVAGLIFLREETSFIKIYKWLPTKTSWYFIQDTKDQSNTSLTNMIRK